jgi:cyclic pyranopterin phosphate synthase
MSSDKNGNDLTHINSNGEAHMVDVGEKASTQRLARARAEVRMRPETLTRLINSDLPKGDVLAAVRIGGIMAAKKTSDLIPLCHPLMLTKVTIDILPEPPDRMIIESTAAVSGQTGVEMEALTAVSVAALTLYDMCKAIDREMVIENICLLEKMGGKSGHWQRDD